jgi:hypothetical protein
MDLVFLVEIILGIHCKCKIKLFILCDALMKFSVYELIQIKIKIKIKLNYLLYKISKSNFKFKMEFQNSRKCSN